MSSLGCRFQRELLIVILGLGCELFAIGGIRLHAGESVSPGKEITLPPPDSAPKPAPKPGLADLSLADLLNINLIVTSVSRREEKVVQVASAIHVITHKDIERNGVTSIPEALRMAPGINVAHVNANRWAISARGFQDTFSNKLLVLIDGRTAYSPLFSGTYWDVKDIMLEDVERIEVIRGPGATVWGANAVNGVINIITKDSKDTQGGLLNATIGTEDRVTNSIRYGGKSCDEKLTWRVFAKYLNRDNSEDELTHDDAHDGWDQIRGGFRLDWLASPEDKLVFHGDIYNGTYDQQTTLASLTPPFSRISRDDSEVSGGYVLGKWSHKFSDNSDMSLQMYFDRTRREEEILGAIHNTGDIDFDHQLKLDQHQIVYGLGYRVVNEDLRNASTVRFRPNEAVRHQFSAFAQDEYEIIQDKFSLTIGSKFEHNEFTGFEIQPSLKTMWTPTAKHSFWTSISRAVRTTSPSDNNERINAVASPLPDGTPILTAVVQNRDLRSEGMIAFEAGYRSQFHKRFSLDLATFYNLYDHLRTFAVDAPRPEASPPPAHLLVPIRFREKMHGETYGGEMALNWNVTDRWKLQGSYSFLKILLHNDMASSAVKQEVAEGNSPKHQFNIRSSLDLPCNVQLDTAVYYVDRLENLNIPSYVRVDARVGWQAMKNLNLSIGVQNIFDGSHPEFGPSAFERRTEVQRNAYFKIQWTF